MILNWIGIFYFSDIVYQLIEEQIRCYNQVFLVGPGSNILNPIQDGGGAKSFSPVSYTNVGISPQNFLTFCFNPFVTLVQNFKFAPSSSPKLLDLELNHPSKKAVFLVKSF